MEVSTDVPPMLTRILFCAIVPVTVDQACEVWSRRQRDMMLSALFSSLSECGFVDQQIGRRGFPASLRDDEPPRAAGGCGYEGVPSTGTK